MKRIISVTLIFIVITAVTGLTLVFSAGRESAGYMRDDAVKLNRIERLISDGDSESAAKLTAELRTEMAKQADSANAPDGRLMVMAAVCAVMIAAMGIYCGHALVRPFEKLTAFADRVANGDFDLPLDYERSNYFGKFTWAFDHMRREIVKARACEREAVENNKTVIASLSHDIKTPVASIRAYAEALEMGMDADIEKRGEYISVIMSKCDEVSKLTNDMFLHSLSDLGKLKLSPEVFELGALTEKTLRELSPDGGIEYKKPAYRIDVYADSVRTAQVIENLINNARKYAKAPFEVSVSRTADSALLTVRDHGSGIPDEDMPFITEKFYRGSNCGGENGSGLGLFIVKYIAEQSGGGLRLKNLPDGLEVSFSLPLSK